jgi:YhcH/YjgK/YiaL family protein
MKLNTLFLLAALTCGSAYGQNARKWFNASHWKTDFPFAIQADKEEFCRQNLCNPAEWEAAYHFLRDSTLLTMPAGRYNLTANGTYANVTDYTTKDTPDTRLYEAHHRYIDVQYIAGGEEEMDKLPLHKILKKEAEHYRPKGDVANYKATGLKPTRYVARKGTVYIFFPSDAHKTNMKVDKQPCKVRKIVVKVPTCTQPDR